MQSINRRVQIHAGEAEPYRGGLRVATIGVRRQVPAQEGERYACTCHEAGVSAVPDAEGYNMLRYPKAWVWGNEFWKTVYYL